MSPTWSQQAPPRNDVRPVVSARPHAPSTRTSPARGTSHLPREIGFLAHYGVSFARLANAAETARVQGVTADRVLIAEAQITEDDFYRALARHLRLRFTDAEVAIAAGAAYPEMIEAGAAAFSTRQGADFLVAPRGAAIGRLIDALSRRGGPSNVVLTTPTHFSGLVRRAASPQIAHAASFGLADFDANLCARGGMNAAQGATLGALASLTAFFRPLAPAASVTTGAALLGILLLATFWLRLSACAASPKPKPPPSRALDDDELPSYSIVIALYHEARVVSQLLGAIAALAYPRSKLDVKLVLEQDDRETFAALRRHGVPPYCEVIVAPPGTPRTKPRALNVALPLLKGELVAVYDAEDIPDPRQLRLAASRFAAAPRSLACLQAQLAIDNIGDGWIPAGTIAQTPEDFPILFPTSTGWTLSQTNTRLQLLKSVALLLLARLRLWNPGFVIFGNWPNTSIIRSGYSTPI